MSRREGTNRRRSSNNRGRDRRRRRPGERKIVPYKRGIQLNFGAVAFFLIFAYIVINCVIYLNKPRISVYEVQQKKLSDSYTCTGIVLRDETVVPAEKSGYLNYFFADGSKVSKNSVVYTLDETGEIYQLLSRTDYASSLSKNDRKLLWKNISDFRSQYSNSKFSTVSDFMYNVENTVMEISSSAMSDRVEKILSDNELTGTYRTVSSENSGMISYSVDGYEDKSVSDITEEDFYASSYEKQQIRTNEKVEKGAPAYKLVTGEDWTIVLQLSEDLYEQLCERQKENRENGQDTLYLKMTLLKDNISVKRPCELQEKDGNYFAVIAMDDYIVHYVDDRFIKVDISLDNAQGLKIPTSAVLKKEFFVVPKEYFTEGGDSNKSGLIKEVYDKSGDVTYKFVECSSYYVDEDDMAYIDKSLFSSGEWIRNQSNQERYQVGVTKKLHGVYNVNYGYCVFKRIEIAYRNKEYCIVKANTSNGLSSYDHIIVDADTVTEDDLINNYKSE